MRVILSPRAEKQLKKLPKIDQIAVGRKIRKLKVEKTAEGLQKLKGYPNIFRVRVGDYRLVFRKNRQEIYIVLIRHRKDVYRLLKKLFL